jgi:cytochrome c peroxidase
MKSVFVIFIYLSVIIYASDIKPIPESIKVDKQKAKLGKMLFFDPILSKDNTISCSSCHDLKNGGDDGLVFSYGVGGKQGSINAPTVLNAVYNFRQFWDGRAKDLQEQALGPIQNPVEMDMDINKAVQKLQTTKRYKEAFDAIYKDGVTKQNIANAIAEYEKTLITPNAPFDRYLKGDKNAISKKAKRGYELFKYKGCIICHNGINIGGNLFNKFGIYKDSNSTNLGRYNLTHRAEDRYVFKVPSLRNISKTAPYMHDGRFQTLKEAVVFMSQAQLGRYMSDDEIDDIVEFLKTLDGQLPQGVE